MKHILLDNQYSSAAQISDFGLAKLMPEGQQSCVTSRVLGTFGYFDPEYTLVSCLHIKSKSEVSINLDIILLFSSLRQTNNVSKEKRKQVKQSHNTRMMKRV